MIDIISDKDSIRIDKYLADVLPYSRSEISDSLKKGELRINSKKVKPSYKLSKGDHIKGRVVVRSLDLSPKKMDLDIVYEDEDFIAINKDPELIVHPSLSNPNPSLVNGLLAYTEDLSDYGGEDRPGIVHRLDMDTSGLILICKNNEVHEYMSRLFKDRQVKKSYIAIVNGKLDKKGEINFPISRNKFNKTKMAVDPNGEKSALTYYQPLAYNEDYTLVKVNIITGRTHQIRVHMAHINHSVLGDKIYGVKKERIKSARQMLHAYGLEFIHPKTNKIISLKAPLKDDFKRTLKKTNISYDLGRL